MKKHLISVLVVLTLLVGAPFVVSKVSAAELTIRDLIQLLIAVGAIAQDKVPAVNAFLASYDNGGNITTTAVNSTTTVKPIGGDTDAYGCKPSAGYSWCAVKNKCLRTWEEKCEVSSTIPSITVLSPNGGETWTKGTTQTIKWQDNRPMPTCNSITDSTAGVSPSCLPFGNYYDIYLKETCAGEVCTSIARPGYQIASKISGYSYDWTVGTIKDLYATIISDNYYIIQVCQAGTSICDSSYSFFKIVSPTSNTATYCTTQGTQMYTLNDGSGYIGCDIVANGSFDLSKSYCEGQLSRIRATGLQADPYGRANRYYTTLKNLKPQEQVDVYINSNNNYIKCAPSLNVGVISQNLLTESVKCIFKNSKTTQTCNTTNRDGKSYEFSGIETAGGEVSGYSGENITWKSSCGGYAYTTMDGQYEYANFICEIPPINLIDQGSSGGGGGGSAVPVYNLSSTASIGYDEVLKLMKALK